MNNKSEKAIDKYLYVEGQDQFRGWFNSSLILSTIIRKKSPFEKIITHGFVVDENGKKMSKSLGNTIDPDELIKKYGVDVIRMWVASSNFNKEVKISENILCKIEENYQKLRNSLRFILGNFNLANTSMLINIEKMNLENIYILFKMNELRKRCKEKYEEHNFTFIYTSIINFCTNDLSSFYFEISKDELYCDSLESKNRKEIITSLYYIVSWMLEIIFPLFPHLSEEVYQLIPKEIRFSKEKSINLVCEFPNIKFSENLKKNVENVDECFFLIKKDVYQLLENLKKNEAIKTNDQVKIEIFLEDVFFQKIENINLKKMLIVSEVEVNKKNKEYIKKNESNILVIYENKAWDIIISKTEKGKCERCRKYKLEKSESEIIICSRCEDTYKEWKNIASNTNFK